MASNPCNSSALTGILSSLTGSRTNAQSQAAALASAAREARSVAVSSNAGSAFANGKTGAGFATAMSGEYIKGLRNRLLLKYAGVDYEFFNVYDLRYRDNVSI
jgi:hypothetical protein